MGERAGVAGEAGSWRSESSVVAGGAGEIAVAQPREAELVAAGELAAVQADREDLAPDDAHLDASARQPGSSE